MTALLAHKENQLFNESFAATEGANGIVKSANKKEMKD